MADIESPEDFAKRMATYQWSPEAQQQLAETVRARDAAVRRATLLDVVLRLEAHDDPWADDIAREFRALATGGSDV